MPARLVPAIPVETSLDAALGALRAGGVVAFRTDTLYGLSALPGQPGFSRLLALKQRDSRPFLSLEADAARALEHAASPGPLARRLAEAVWPGPVTLLLPAGPGLPGHLVGPDGSWAVRVPADPWCLRLLAALGGPLPSTSANLPGRPPEVSAEGLLASLGEWLDLVVDAGPAAVAAASALVDARGDEPVLLRPGPPGTREKVLRASRGS